MPRLTPQTRHPLLPYSPAELNDMCRQGACCFTRKFAYVLGLVLLGIAVKMSMWGTFFLAWVYREGGTQTSATTVEYYGLFTACSPDEFDVCQHTAKSFPDVAGAVKGSQVLAVMSFIMMILCFAFEIVCCIPYFGLRDKCKIVFDNRAVEYIISCGAVLGFLGMVVFASEVKNKANRDIGQEDQTAFGFGFLLGAQVTAVLGCCMLACGRAVPKAVA